MADPAIVAVLVALLLLVAWRSAAVVRRRENPALRAHWFALAALALGLVMYVPVVALAVDHALGVPNVAGRLGQGLTITGACSAQILLLHLVRPRAEATRLARRRVALLLLALAVMAAAFLVAPTGDEALRFTVAYGTAPWMWAYWAAYLSFLVTAGVDIARLCTRYSRATAGALALGLRLIAVGAVLGVADGLVTGAYVLVRHAGLDDLPLGQATLHLVLQPLAAALVVAGSALPALARRRPLRPLGEVLARRRALRGLDPLWRDLLAEAPELVLDDASWQRALSRDVDALDFRLYRHVIELRDVRLLLRPWVPASTAAAATKSARVEGLEGVTLQAAVEAACLREAVQRRRADGPPAVAAEEVAVPEHLEEAEWWLAVARAWSRQGTTAEARPPAEVRAS